MALPNAPQSDLPRDPLVIRQRMPLGRSRRRLSFERRVRIWLASAASPLLLAVWRICSLEGLSAGETIGILAGVALVWAIVAAVFFDSLVRPLQTLSNIVASLREEDYTFRARGARRGDALGDLALEVNALAGAMQQQRGSALDALALANRVMTSMQSPVLAFDERRHLRLLNAAAEKMIGLSRREAADGRTAEALQLEGLLECRDEGFYVSVTHTDGPTHETRWSVRRSNFRLHGVPHTLFVLTDLSAALREEERVAWQRLIRVLGHEINNSLTPIKSIASMLRSRPLQLAREVHTSQDLDDLRRGLMVIEDRADSLNRFLQAYQQISRLPQPAMRRVLLCGLVERTVPLERRLRVTVGRSPDVELSADPDQLQQLLINLLKNAADAALDAELRNPAPEVEVHWSHTESEVLLQVTDNGPGLANPGNLFVPFYTTKPGGAGIGLTLSRQIAIAHGGSITLRNRAGTQGCVAEVVLPLGIPDAPQPFDDRLSGSVS